MFSVLSPLMRRLIRGLCFFRNWANKVAASGVCEMSTGVQLIDRAEIRNGSGSPQSIRLEKDVVCLGLLCTFCKDAKISVGEGSYIGPDSRVMAFKDVHVGARVQISHGVNIYDSNSHSLSAASRWSHMRHTMLYGHPDSVPDVDVAPVFIDDDAWIGFGASILKGVRIGRGAVVGAGSVVTKDVLPYTVVVGNPQRVVGEAFP